MYVASDAALSTEMHGSQTMSLSAVPADAMNSPAEQLSVHGVHVSGVASTLFSASASLPTVLK